MNLSLSTFISEKLWSRSSESNGLPIPYRGIAHPYVLDRLGAQSGNPTRVFSLRMRNSGTEIIRQNPIYGTLLPVRTHIWGNR